MFSNLKFDVLVAKYGHYEIIWESSHYATYLITPEPSTPVKEDAREHKRGLETPSALIITPESNMEPVPKIPRAERRANSIAHPLDFTQRATLGVLTMPLIPGTETVIEEADGSGFDNSLPCSCSPTIIISGPPSPRDELSSEEEDGHSAALADE